MPETPQPPEPQPAPGYYPDGNGTQRYWDGAAWTENVQAPAGAYAAPLAATATDRPWFKKKRIIIPAAIVVLIIIGSAAGSSEDKDDTEPAVSSATKNVTPKAAPTKEAEAAPIAKEEPAAEKPVVKKAPALTKGQENAVRAADNYLSFAPFSRSGLIKQLEFEKYATADATFAVDEIDADWDEQAVRSAKNYLDMTSFSRDGLITQLEFEGYTTAQASHGAAKNGL